MGDLKALRAFRSPILKPVSFVIDSSAVLLDD